MRVGFVTQWFPPEPGMTGPLAIAEGLADLGHEVHVLTGFPNYPTGRLAAGYPLRPYRRDRWSRGITVHRAPLYPSHDRSALRRAANYLSFAASSTAVAMGRMPPLDVWLVYSSPATAHVPALARDLLRREPVVLMVQDLWPDSVTASGFVEGRRIGRLVERSLHRFCAWSYRRAAVVGYIAPGMRAVLEARSVDARKLVYTPNWADESLFHPIPARPGTRDELGLPDGFLCMYAGNLGELQQLDVLVDAFAELETDGPHLALVGDGVASGALRARAGRLGAANVHIVEPQPARRMNEVLASADVQIVSLRDEPLLRVTMPSKVQSLFAAGRPILAHAPGDVADLVRRSGAGVAVRPGDVAELRACVRRLQAAGDERLRAMGAAGFEFYRSSMSRDAALGRLDAALATATRSRGPRPR